MHATFSVCWSIYCTDSAKQSQLQCNSKMTVTVIAVFKLTLLKSEMCTNVTIIFIQFLTVREYWSKQSIDFNQWFGLIFSLSTIRPLDFSWKGHSSSNANSLLTVYHNNNHFTAVYAWLPWWASTRRNIHPRTAIIIINHPLPVLVPYKLLLQ